MLLAIITAWLAYKKAKLAKRNAWLWALITAFAFILTQNFVSFGLTLLVEIVVRITELSSNSVSSIAGLSLIFSYLVIWRILLFLDGVPEQTSFILPPSPPKFD